jgi:hypothetical protein
MSEEQRYLFDAFGYLVVRDECCEPARVQGRIFNARHRR